jgi:hypothetical protein
MEMFSWRRGAMIAGVSAMLALSAAGLPGPLTSIGPTRAHAAGDPGSDPVPCPAMVISASTNGSGTIATSGSGQGIVISGPGAVAASSSNGSGTIVASGPGQGVAIAGSGGTVISSGSGRTAAVSGSFPGVSISLPGVSVSAGAGSASVSVPGMSIAVPGSTADSQPMCQVFNAQPTGQCGNVQVYTSGDGLFYCVTGQ